MNPCPTTNLRFLGRFICSSQIAYVTRRRPGPAATSSSFSQTPMRSYQLLEADTTTSPPEEKIRWGKLDIAIRINDLREANDFAYARHLRLDDSRPHADQGRQRRDCGLGRLRNLHHYPKDPASTLLHPGAPPPLISLPLSPSHLSFRRPGRWPARVHQCNE